MPGCSPLCSLGRHCSHGPASVQFSPGPGAPQGGVHGLRGAPPSPLLSLPALWLPPTSLPSGAQAAPCRRHRGRQDVHLKAPGVGGGCREGGASVWAGGGGPRSVHMCSPCPPSQTGPRPGDRKCPSNEEGTQNCACPRAEAGAEKGRAPGGREGGGSTEREASSLP